MSKHTPGPWHVFDNREDKSFPRNDAGLIGVGSKRDSDVAHCHGFHGARPVEETLANCKLIAAAPELLVALQNLLAFAEGEFPGACEDDCNVLAAHAAIAKATT